jgi:uncharacterized membrane protein YphA (DoxX/SURF4 family)
VSGPVGPLVVFLRLALAAGFLSAVADRLGLWGPPGGTNVAWGDFATFSAYAAKLNPWAPASLLPAVAWTATGLEVGLAIALIVGFRVRWAGLVSGLLLLAFSFGMTVGTGIKTVFDASVLAAAGAGFALARLGPGPWSFDRVTSSGNQPT